MKTFRTLHDRLLTVMFDGIAGDSVVVGQLGIKDRMIFFEYDRAFLKLGLELSPFKLPLRPGLSRSDSAVFDGLYGLFADSLPDGWGRLLVDRYVQNHGVVPAALTPLDRLRFVGSEGVGALRYEPTESAGNERPTLESLDVFAQYSELVLLGGELPTELIDELYPWGGSSLGARPKLHCYVDKEKQKVTVAPRSASEAWIVKFPSNYDQKDVGAVEYAYHKMAKVAGLRLPEAHLFPSQRSPGYFGVKRFDREVENQRVHSHSASGLLHADHRFPSMDYRDLLLATFHLTKRIDEVEEVFRLMLFNILSCNRDDHSRNFSFLMSEQGVWHAAPAYDLTFARGMGGEHAMMINGEGRDPTLSSVLILVDQIGFKRKEVLEIIENVRSAIPHWKKFASELEVAKETIDQIAKQHKRIDETFFSRR